MIRRSIALIQLATVALLLSGTVLGQGQPSGEYGSIAIGQQISGTLAAIPDPDSLVYHTYVVAVPAGTPSLTITVQGDGADLDLAVKAGSPILDYEDVDYIDVTESPNPSYTVQNPPQGSIYIDVLNLLPNPASYTLSVTGAAAATTPGGNPLTPQGQNPLAPTQADPFAGTYVGDSLTVIVQAAAGQYSGQLELSGQVYPFTATVSGNVLSGNFSAGGQSYPFVATLQGDTLIVESGGSTYNTLRQGGNPLGTAPAPALDNSPVIAQGTVANLTQDNALAFIEALEFSLQQAGYAYTFTDADYQQLLQVIVQAYPQAEQQEQAVLAQAREIWSRVQVNWAAASLAEQREFVLGVFVLAFGEEYVNQLLGQAGGGGGGGSGGGGACTDIDSCMSAYADPGTMQDTMNAQGCWAAAGCTDYDAGSDTFTYEEPYIPPTDY